jgi:hypothetical protein
VGASGVRRGAVIGGGGAGGLAAGRGGGALFAGGRSATSGSGGGGDAGMLPWGPAFGTRSTASWLPDSPLSLSDGVTMRIMCGRNATSASACTSSDTAKATRIADILMSSCRAAGGLRQRLIGYSTRTPAPEMKAGDAAKAVIGKKVCRNAMEGGSFMRIYTSRLAGVLGHLAAAPVARRALQILTMIGRTTLCYRPTEPLW